MVGVVDGGIQPSGSFEGWITILFGDAIDYANTRPAERLLLAPTLVFNPGARLELSLGHTFERLTVEGGQLYRAGITRLRAVYHFNVRTLFRATLQHVDYRYNPELYAVEIDPEYRRLLSQYLFSYKVNPRTLLYVGYDDNQLGNHEFGLTRTNWTVFAKIGYAWVM